MLFVIVDWFASPDCATRIWLACIINAYVSVWWILVGFPLQCATSLLPHLQVTAFVFCIFPYSLHVAKMFSRLPRACLSPMAQSMPISYGNYGNLVPVVDRPVIILENPVTFVSKQHQSNEIITYLVYIGRGPYFNCFLSTIVLDINKYSKIIVLWIE